MNVDVQPIQPVNVAKIGRSAETAEEKGWPTNWHKLYQSFDEKGTKSIAEQ